MDELEEVAAQMRREIETTFGDNPELRDFWLAALAQALEQIEQQQSLHCVRFI